MASAICKFTFKNFPQSKVGIRKEWITCTKDLVPNDWTIRVIFLEEMRDDFTAQAEIDFLMPAAEHLLNAGSKFKLHSFQHSEVEVEVIVKIP